METKKPLLRTLNSKRGCIKQKGLIMQKSIYQKITKLQEKIKSSASEEEKNRHVEEFNSWVETSYSLKKKEEVKERFWKTFIHSLRHMNFNEDENE